MSKHTPGPWEFDGICKVNAGRIEICEVCEVDRVGCNLRFRENSESNALLIAAAPDLLAALEEVMDCWLFGCAMPEKKAAIDQARAALAKTRVEI